MSADAPTAEAVRGDLAALSAPLREHLGNIEAAISQREQELAELRELRRTISTTLKNVDPTYEPPARNGNKPGPKPRTDDALDPGKLEIFRDFILAHRHDFPDGDIMASTLIKLANGRTIGLGTKHYTAALAELRDQGVLRLDRKARGGGSIYKIVG